jgi:O-antigen ligase
MVSPNFNKRTLETFNSLQHTVQEKEALNDSTGLRFMMWQVASDIIIKNPLIGVGIGDERDSYHYTLLHELPDLHTHIHGFTDLHNTYLKIFVSTGIIGLSLFLMIFFTLYKQLDSSVELHTVGAIMVSLMLQYMFIGNLPASYLTILFIFIISLALKPTEEHYFSHSSVKLSS